MICEAAGIAKSDKGNMTTAADRHDHRFRSRPQEGRPASAPLEDLRRIGQPIGLGEVVIQSSGRRRCRRYAARALPCTQPSRKGYRAWGGGCMAKQLQARSSRRHTIHQLVPSGWVGAFSMPGLLLGRWIETAGQHDSPTSGGLEGRQARPG